MSEVLLAHKVAFVALGVVVVCIVALYAPTQDLYCAWRDTQLLQATLDATNQVNEQTTQDISNLMSEEGIEDKARELGYVKEGESTVVVSGLNEETDDATTETTDQTPWYVQACDVIFQYSAA